VHLAAVIGVQSDESLVVHPPPAQLPAGPGRGFEPRQGTGCSRGHVAQPEPGE